MSFNPSSTDIEQSSFNGDNSFTPLSYSTQLAKVDKPHGLEITIVTSAKNKEEGRLLLEKIGMPFEKNES